MSLKEKMEAAISKSPLVVGTYVAIGVNALNEIHDNTVVKSARKGAEFSAKVVGSLSGSATALGVAGMGFLPYMATSRAKFAYDKKKNNGQAPYVDPNKVSFLTKAAVGSGVAVGTTLGAVAGVVGGSVGAGIGVGISTVRVGKDVVKGAISVKKSVKEHVNRQRNYKYKNRRK